MVLVCVLLPALLMADDDGTRDRIRESTVAIDHVCDQLLFWSDGSGACLDKDNKQLLRLSADGKPSLVYARDLERPQSIRINPDRVAVLDRNGLQVFSRSGELLFRYGDLKSVRAFGYSGSRLLVNDKTGLLDIVDASSVRRFNPEREFRLPRRKLEYLASDPGGRVYAAARRGNRLLVFLPESDRQLLIDLPGVRKVFGLVTDTDDNVYVLTQADSKQIDILIYHGVQQQHRFTVGEKLEVGGFSVATGEDSVISVFDKAQSRVQRYQYRQHPARVNNLRARAYPDRVELDWVPSTESFVAGYVVYASSSAQGELEKLGEFKQARATIPQADRRWTRFAVAARSRSGLVGEHSIEVANSFDYGYQLYRKGSFQQAIEHFLQSSDASGVAGQEYLARGFLQVGNWPAALSVARQLEYLAVDKSTKSTSQLLQAEALYRLQRYTQASQRIAGSTSPGARWLCARIEHDTGKYVAARRCLDKLLKQQPDNLDARLLLLEVDITLRDRKREAAQLKKLAATANKDHDARVLASIGQLYLRQGNLKYAAAWLGRAIKLDRKNTAARGGLVELYIKRKNIVAARSLALKMIVEPGQQLDGYLYLGDIAMQQGKPGEAAQIFRKALEIIPAEPRALLALARSYRALANRQQLRATLNRLLKVRPLNTEALTWLAELEQQEGQSGYAVSLLQQVLAVEPRNRDLQIKLASMLADEGSTWLAAQHARAADRIRSQDDSVKLLAELSLHQGRFDDALAFYGRLAKQRRQAVMANLQIAEIHLGFGRYRSAKSALERILRLQKNNRAALRKLVQVYRELGQYKSAIHIARRLVTIDSRPEYRLLLNALKDEQKQSASTRKSGSSITVKDLKVLPIVAPALKRGTPVDIASLSLVAKGKNPVKDITIRSFVGDLVGVAAERHIDTLKPGEPQQVNLQAELGGRLSSTKDQLFGLVVEIHVGDKVIEKRALLPVFGRNVIDWSTVASVKRLVSGPPIVPVPEQVPPDPLTGLADVYAWLDLSAINLEKEISPTAVVQVQSPLQTWRNRKGGAEEIGLLLAKVLVNRGDDVVLIRRPDRLLLLVTPGDKTQSLSPTVSTIAVRYRDRSWLPLDISAWSGGLIKMLEQGKAQLATVDPATTVELSARSNKRAAATTGPASKVTVLARANERRRTIAWLHSTLSADEAGDSPVRAGDWYRQHGYPAMAVEQYRQALVNNPYNVAAATRLGEQLQANRQTLPAIDCYLRAARLDPFDAASRNSLAEIFKETGQNRKVDELVNAARLLGTP